MSSEATIRADFENGRFGAVAMSVSKLTIGDGVPPDIFYIGGVANLRLRRLDLAAGCLQAAVALDPSSGAAWSALGHVRFEMRQFGLAEQAWSRAASLGNLIGRDSQFRRVVSILRGREDFDPRSIRETAARFDHAVLPNPAHSVTDPAVRLPVVFSLGPDRRFDVALTIDDGPSGDISPVLLDTLRDHGASATHFLVGRWVEEFPEQVRRMVDFGDQVFSHGWSHTIFPDLSAEQIASEMERTEVALRRFRPTPSPYPFRLPGGMGWTDPRVHAAIRAWNPDTMLIHWTVTTSDHQVPLDFGANEDIVFDARIRVFDAVLDPYFSAPVVLMHDNLANNPRKQARSFSELFGGLIDVVHAAGMRFVAPTPAEWAAAARR